MDVRSSILSHAARLFAGRGFSGTSVQEIADAVGVRKQSLLYHFNSKDQLREKVISQMLMHWNETLPELLMQASREERFDMVMESLCSFFLDDPDRARLFLREVLDRPDHLRQLLSQFVHPWIEIVAKQIDRAKDKGLVQKHVDAEAYAIQVITMVVATIGAMDTWAALLPPDGSKNSRERMMKELVRIAGSSLYGSQYGKGD